MSQIRQAGIIAAGKGERMHPVTLTTPKPMVEVNGVRMIDTVIDALHQNPYYDTCNNISSLYMAREHLEDTMILDGDQIIYNPEILAPEFDRSGYNAVYTEGYTKEWLMQVEDGIVQSCSRTGGEKGWQLYSISRWNKEDGRKLKHFLEYEFEEKKNRQIYWDDVAMFCHFDQFELGIREMKKEDIIEIDDIEELREADPKYREV